MTAFLLALVLGGACPDQSVLVLPSTDTPLPTNTIFRVIFGQPRAEPTFTLRTKDGVNVPLVTTRIETTTLPSFTVRPQLAQNTAYELTVTTEVIARFTTGAGEDTTKPTLSTITGRHQRWKASNPPHWKDPRGAYVELTSTFDGASGFEILEGTIVRSVIRAAPRARFGTIDTCRGADFVFPTRGPLRLEVRAFDAAGNTSEARSIVIE